MKILGTVLLTSLLSMSAHAGSITIEELNQLTSLMLKQQPELKDKTIENVEVYYNSSWRTYQVTLAAPSGQTEKVYLKDDYVMGFAPGTKLSYVQLRHYNTTSKQLELSTPEKFQCVGTQVSE